MENESSIQLANAMIQFIAYFTPAFIAFLVIEWVVGLFRRDS